MKRSSISLFVSLAAIFVPTVVSAGIMNTAVLPFLLGESPNYQYWNGTIPYSTSKPNEIVSGWLVSSFQCPPTAQRAPAGPLKEVHVAHTQYASTPIVVDGVTYSGFYRHDPDSFFYLKNGHIIARISVDGGPFVPILLAQTAKFKNAESVDPQVLWQGNRPKADPVTVSVQYAIVQTNPLSVTPKGVFMQNYHKSSNDILTHTTSLLGVRCVQKEKPSQDWTFYTQLRAAPARVAGPASTCNYLGNQKYAINLGEHDGALVRNYSSGTNFGEGTVKLEFECDFTVKPYVTLSDGKDASNTSDIVKTTVPGVGVQAFNSNIGGGSTAIKMGPQSKNIGTLNQFSLDDMRANETDFKVNSDLIFKFVRTSEDLDLTKSNKPEATVLATFAYH